MISESAATGPEEGSARRRLRPNPLGILTVLAVAYTLYFARAFFLPVTFAILLNFLLSPVVRWLGRLRIPAEVGAALVVLVLLGSVGMAGYGLATPVRVWSEKAPQAIAITQQQLRKLLRPFEKVSQTAKQVETAASQVGGTGSPRPQEVVVRGPTFMSRVFGSTPKFIAMLIEIMILLYFLLAAGDLFLRKLIKLLPHVPDKLTAMRIARGTQASISTYLGTSALLFLLEGLVVAGAMALIGMPNPLLWGALTFLLEFIPYIGAITLTVVLFIAGLTAFEDPGRALLAPAAFLLINALQANLLTPVLQGRRLALNPVAVFIGIAFWYWIWGVPGAFVAVPILATLKICGDHIEGLAPLGEFLSAREETPLP